MLSKKHKEQATEAAGVFSLACSALVFLLGIRSYGVSSYLLISASMVLIYLGYICLRAVEGRREREELRVLVMEQVHRALLMGTPTGKREKVTDQDLVRLREYLRDNGWDQADQDKNTAFYTKDAYEVLVPLKTIFRDVDLRIEETAKVILHIAEVPEPSATEAMWSIVYSDH